MPTNIVRIKELQDEIEWLNCQLENYRFNDKRIKVLPNIIFLIKAGKIITAIKEYRDVCKETLLDAKNTVFAIRLDVLRGKYGDFDIDLVDPTARLTLQAMEE